MYKGITPTFTFIFPENVDLSQASNVYVTFADNRRSTILRKVGEDLLVDGNEVSVYLTQEETLSFPTEPIKIQINWTYNEGDKIKRACSKIITVQFVNNLEPRVLE